jgi:hypothetical protein
VLQVVYPKHKTVVDGIQHQTLDQYTGVSDLIAKLKMNSPQSKVYCLYNELFKALKIVLQISFVP